jgi:hypothetical protein
MMADMSSRTRSPICPSRRTVFRRVTRYCGEGFGRWCLASSEERLADGVERPSKALAAQIHAR